MLVSPTGFFVSENEICGSNESGTKLVRRFSVALIAASARHGNIAVQTKWLRPWRRLAMRVP
jgi:hypothetical protein